MSEHVQPPSEIQLSLEAQIEALIFVASDATPINQLANVLNVTSRSIEKALESLDKTYAGRGLCLQYDHGRVRLTTTPETASIVEDFLGLEATGHLSRAALETLAIVAYQQPITRPYIDVVRGVNSDSVLKTLLFKGLIQETGRAEGPGRPILYSTTPEFLSHFGL
ncbi:MAG: SMC-Scp complex subunit ScpB, partial [Anaerolineae bacterium]|nr:SMC-Scp complex subunit ScpB [Anaerolineae bacterium]